MMNIEISSPIFFLGTILDVPHELSQGFLQEISNKFSHSILQKENSRIFRIFIKILLLLLLKRKTLRNY